MKIKKIGSGIACFVILVMAMLFSVLFASSEAFAERYTGNYGACIRDSNHGGIYSVANYACRKAAVSTQSICATWLAAAGNSTSTTIVASAATGTVPVSFYGMCTDRTDTTSSLYLIGDNGSISGFNTRFTRTNVWGYPSSMGATLNVAQFIQGLNPVVENGSLVYTRMVQVIRSHSDARSTDHDYSLIKLVVGDCGTMCEVPETQDDFCKKHAPASYTLSNAYNGTTSIDVYIRNADPRFGGMGMGAFSSGPIYAMPTDTIDWKTCYYPGVQTTTFTEVSDLNGGNKGYTELSTTSCQPALSVTNQQLYVKSGIWENYYQVYGDAGGGGETFPTGQSTPPGMWDNSATTTLFRVGDNSNPIYNGTFYETGITGSPTTASISSSSPTVDINDSPCCKATDKDCVETNSCYTCTNGYASAIISATVGYSNASDTEIARVPYNYINYTGVNLAGDIVYSGEDVQIGNVWTTVSPRTNNTTLATYATIVRQASLNLFAYVTDNPGSFSGDVVSSSSNGCSVIGGSNNSSSVAKQCFKMDSETGMTLNEDGSLQGASKTHWDERKYNAFDAAAGDYLCFVSAVYPSDSGSDDMMKVSGSGKWRYSAPSCMKIAKKPTFQVWGSDMYSVNSIDAFVGEKKNIYNGYFVNWNSMPSFAKTGGTTTYFGSWVEEGLVLKNGITDSVFSGASTGENSNAARAGSTGEFCDKRAPLSFANYLDLGSSAICPRTSAVGNSNISSDLSNRENILKYWIGEDNGITDTVAGNTFNLSDPYAIGTDKTSATGKTIRYVNKNNNITITSSTVPKEVTYLIRSNKTVTIAGDIRYSEKNYTNIGQIPKVMIYAKDVIINCDVKEIDAVIITDVGGEVYTCADTEAVEPGECITIKDEDIEGVEGVDELEDKDEECVYQASQQAKLKETNDPKRSNQLKIVGAVITDKIDMGRTYGAAAWNPNKFASPTDGLAAEIFDYDSTLLMWSEFMSGSAETDTLQTTYTHELAPRY